MRGLLGFNLTTTIPTRFPSSCVQPSGHAHFRQQHQMVRVSAPVERVCYVFRVSEVELVGTQLTFCMKEVDLCFRQKENDKPDTEEVEIDPHLVCRRLQSLHA